MPSKEEPANFVEALETLLNKYSVENLNNTPDFILARYMLDTLNCFTHAITSRDQWYGIRPWAKLDEPLEP